MSKAPRSAIDQIEWIRNLLAILLVSAFVGAMMLFTFYALPEQNKDIITYMVGQLSGMALTALGFYFVNKVGQDAIDAKRTENTGKALEAIKATAEAAGAASPTEPAADAAQDTADAAQEKADEIKGDK